MLTFNVFSCSEYDRHSEHAGGPVWERSGVSLSPDEKKERRQGGQCVLSSLIHSLFSSLLASEVLFLSAFSLVCLQLTQITRSAGLSLAAFLSPLLSPSLLQRSDSVSSIHLLSLSRQGQLSWLPSFGFRFKSSSGISFIEKPVDDSADIAKSMKTFRFHVWVYSSCWRKYFCYVTKCLQPTLLASHLVVSTNFSLWTFHKWDPEEFIFICILCG